MVSRASTTVDWDWEPGERELHEAHARLETEIDDDRWLAHACTVAGCPTVEIHGSCNHAQYLCYRDTHHVQPAPMRPVVLGVVETFEPERAREIREAASLGMWRRPAQHFAFDATEGCELLTEPAEGEDWPSWPGGADDAS